MTEIRDLSFSYKKKEPLFSSLTLRLDEGSIYGLLGKNGAGKTTLLRIVCGLLFPGEGTCTVDGLESRKRLPSMLEEIYFLPEEFGVPAVTPKASAVVVKTTAMEPMPTVILRAHPAHIATVTTFIRARATLTGIAQRIPHRHVGVATIARTTAVPRGVCRFNEVTPT